MPGSIVPLAMFRLRIGVKKTVFIGELDGVKRKNVVFFPIKMYCMKRWVWV